MRKYLPMPSQVKQKRAVGRPPKLTPEQREEVYNSYAQFIQDEADPTLAKFVSSNTVATQYDITDDNIKDWTEFSTLVKRAVRKQESHLLEQGGSGKYNPTIAIFRLKQPQHGYTDRQDRDITSGGNAITPVLVRFIDKQENVNDDNDTTGI